MSKLKYYLSPLAMILLAGCSNPQANDPLRPQADEIAEAFIQSSDSEEITVEQALCVGKVFYSSQLSTNTLRKLVKADGEDNYIIAAKDKTLAASNEFKEKFTPCKLPAYVDPSALEDFQDLSGYFAPGGELRGTRPN